MSRRKPKVDPLHTPKIRPGLVEANRLENTLDEVLRETLMRSPIMVELEAAMQMIAKIGARIALAQDRDAATEFTSEALRLFPERVMPAFDGLLDCIADVAKRHGCAVEIVTQKADEPPKATPPGEGAA
jgi:hypothetical protein